MMLFCKKKLQSAFFEVNPVITIYTKLWIVPKLLNYCHKSSYSPRCPFDKSGVLPPTGLLLILAPPILADVVVIITSISRFTWMVSYAQNE